MKKVLNIILTCIVTLSGIITILFSFGIMQEIYYHNKFKDTNVNLDSEKFYEKWGEPDNYLGRDKEDKIKILIYYKGILGINAYIFKFNNDDKLIAKFIDD